ncbi:MAG: large conductance mechanosensitive channel protein MscL [Erysipelotrichaceae bacterium]|nr:large conductance mechanosensitive channel protein MscL [Erysipelotrichaceae bacterium]
MKKFMEEFKTFAMRGNVMDMAVGVVIGGAFKAIVDSLVSDIISPLLGSLMGNSLAEKAVEINGASLTWGAFVTAIINFIIVAFVLFLVIKAVNAMKKKEEPAPEPEPEPVKSDETLLLEEIRDLLAKK